jgi:predicted anti-sigma-YlaC factor YlaD
MNDEEENQMRGRVNVFSLIVVVVVSMVLSSNCSIKKMALKQVANTLTAPSGGNVFTRDNDPELVGDALPFTIKLYETLMESLPNHPGLKLQTGSLYIMYANAFLQNPADMMTDDEMAKEEFLLKRAKNLYLRGRDIILEAVTKKYPGFLKEVNADQFERALSPMKKEDVPFLYWAAAGWLGAFAIDPFDMKLGMTVPRAAAIMNRVLQLDPDYGNGAIHDFYVLYYGSMPDYMGGDFEKAREHYRKAVEASGGKNTSPYLSLATTVAVKEQNVTEFKALLQKVLDINPDDDPDNRLLNTLNQRKARWLSEHVEDFFLEAGDEDDTGIDTVQND